MHGKTGLQILRSPQETELELRIKLGGLALHHSTDIRGEQSRIVISMGLGVKKTSVRVPAQPLTNGMTWAKLSNLCQPQEMIVERA